MIEIRFSVVWWEYDEVWYNQTPKKRVWWTVCRKERPEKSMMGSMIGCAAHHTPHHTSHQHFWNAFLGTFLRLWWLLNASEHLSESMIGLDRAEIDLWRQLVAFPVEFFDQTKNADLDHGQRNLSFWKNFPGPHRGRDTRYPMVEYVFLSAFASNSLL